MINSEDELNRLFATYIASEMGSLVSRPHFGVPEEEVLKEKPMPYLTLFYLYDELYYPGWINGTSYMKRIGEGQATTYERWKTPEALRFFYQLDIYSKTQANLVQLSTALSKAIYRRGTTILDKDNDPVAIERTDVQDFGRDSFRLEKSEERVFRRTYTYSLECVFQPNTEPIEHVGAVLGTLIELEILAE